MIADLITTEPVPVRCPQCKGDGMKRGTMFRVTISRLEEGLGHEGYKCDKCGYRIKHVPIKHVPKAEAA